MVSDEAYLLREATGTSAVAETARALVAVPRDLFIQAPVRGIFVEIWDALQAEQ